MKHSVKILSSVITLLFACTCRPANADLILSFSADDGASFADTFDVGVGERLEIGVYLQQRLPEERLTSEGLVSWGFNLSRTSANLGSLTRFEAAPLFDFENHDVLTGSGYELEYASTSMDGAVGDSILLGSFQFNANEAGTSLFTVNDRLVGTGTGNASWITSSFTELDEEIFGSGAANSFQFTINTTAVPEPSSLMLLGCTAAGLAFRRHRRTQAHRQSPVELR